MVPDQSPCKNSHTPAPPSVGFSHAKHCSQEVLRCRLRMSDNLESQVQAIMQASLDKQNRLLPSPQINETFSLIFASLAVAEISLTLLFLQKPQILNALNWQNILRMLRLTLTRRLSAGQAQTR